MSNVAFILDGDYQHAAIYVNDKKYGDSQSIDYDPTFASTWFDLIHSVRNFDKIAVYHLSKYGIDTYLHNQQSFPESLSDFKANELHLESSL